MRTFVRGLVVALALALFVVSASGCYSITYTTGKPPAGPAFKVSANMFLYGLVGTTIDLRRVCPEVAWLASAQSPVDWILSYITFGIYTPMSVYIWCATPSAPVHALMTGNLTLPKL